jgi:hypothetical protein
MSHDNLQLELAKGQLWKTGTTYIHIVECGKRLIQYKNAQEARATVSQNPNGLHRGV